MLDDVLVYRFEAFYYLVVNASNRLKIVDWITRHQGGFHVHVEDQTVATFMLAVQGPRALDILHPHVNVEISDLKYYSGCEAMVFGRPALVSRTGYTGEDGFEIVVASSDGPDVWHRLIADGKEMGLAACGLGARDTLRLEAGMALYGHELSESIDPLTAGLSFAVKLNAGDFIGKAALLRHQERRDSEGARRARTCREAHRPRRLDRVSGRTTDRASHLRHILSHAAKADRDGVCRQGAVAIGHAVEVDIRGKREAATVVNLPFYHRPA